MEEDDDEDKEGEGEGVSKASCGSGLRFWQLVNCMGVS